MNKKPKCPRCRADLQLVQSGYLRSTIKMDGTKGYMIMGHPDGVEEFLICQNVKCNSRFEKTCTATDVIQTGREIKS